MHNICNVILVFLAVLQKLSTNVRVSASKQSMVCTYMYVWSYVIAIVINVTYDICSLLMLMHAYIYVCMLFDHPGA